MSSSIPSPACHISVISYSSHRHLVSVPSPSRIGYRMISQRNPSQAIPDTSLPPHTHLPAPSHRPTCFPPRFPPHRVARRVESKPDAILLAIRSLLASLACRHLIVPSHRLILSPVACLPYPPHFVAILLPPHAAHPSHRHRSISSAHLPFRRASRRASRLASPNLIGLSHRSLLAYLVHLIRLINLIGSSPASYPHATSDKTSGELTETAHGTGNSQMGSGTPRHPLRSDTANTPPRPPYSPYEPHDARIPTTNTTTGKRPLHAPHNASDGQHETRSGTTILRLLADDKTPRRNAACLSTRWTRRYSRPQRLLLAYRYDNETPDTSARLPTRRRNAERHGDACYPPHDTTTRDERRGEGSGTQNGTGDGTTKKTGRLRQTRNGPKNGTRYEIERYAANYSPSESSGKRWKSRIRER